MAQVKTLYEDKELTQIVYPRSVAGAIKRTNGTDVETDLTNAWNEIGRRTGFIDTSNFIGSLYNVYTYTATQDCWLFFHKNGESTVLMYLDGRNIGNLYGYGGYAQQTILVVLKKGQTFSTSSGANQYYNIYGM